MSSFLSKLQCASPKEAHSLVMSRFLHNVRYFYAHNRAIYTLVSSHKPQYELIIDDKGISIADSSGKSLYPDKEGHYTMWENSEYYAASPLTNPLWHVSNNHYGYVPLPDTIPFTARAHEALFERCKQEKEFSTHAFHLPSGFLPSTTLLGLGGGLYLAMLLEEVKYIHSLFIYEPIVDFFAISCYFVDYSELFAKVSQGNLFLCIEKTPDRELITNFFTKQKISTNFLRLELSLYDHPLLRQTQERIIEAHNANARGWGTFDDEVIGLMNHLENITSRKPFLDSAVQVHTPLCIVGNGSSLDELIPFLKKNQENMIIFSCGTSLAPLLKNGIKPDFHIETERREHIAPLLEKTGLNDIPLLCASVVDKTTAEQKNSYFFIRDASVASALEPHKTLRFTSPVVGNAGTALGMLFGKTVILCALDVGFRKNTTLHSTQSLYADEEKTGTIPHDAVKTTPNFSDDEVYTTSLLSLSRSAHEKLLSHAQGRTVYNIGRGAKIEGAQAIQGKDIPFSSSHKQEDIMLIKGCFSPLKDEIAFYESRLILTQIDTYLVDTATLLGKPCETKKEFFTRLDDLSRLGEEAYNRYPVAALLFNGTVMHLLMVQYLGILHIHTNNTATLYRDLLTILFNALADMREDLCQKLENYPHV